MNSSRPKIGLTQPAVFAATLGGIGWLPWAPGTWGSVLGLVVGWVLNDAFEGISLLIFCSVFFLSGIWACARYSLLTNTSDSSDCVIDEFVGQLLVVCLIPQDVISYILAFAFFRFFDIVKLWPTGWIDKNVSGGLGIMLDDLAAGLQTLLLFWGASRLFEVLVQ